MIALFNLVSEIFAGFLVCGLVAIAYWQRSSIMLFVLSAFSGVAFGLYYASASTEPYLWIIGAIIAILGVISFFKAVSLSLPRRKD